MDYCPQVTHSTAPAAFARTTPAAAPLNQLPLALFDEIECGLIVCDDGGLIHFANQAARDELTAGRLLARLDGCLVRAPGVAGALEHALRAATQRGRRSLVRLDRSGDRLLASVLPLALASTDCPLVLVMLGRRRPCSDLGLEMLARSYGLTLAERRVLSALMREATPREIAAENDVALSTVRTQISSLRTKFGTRRIEGLLLHLAGVPPLASALRAGFGHITEAARPALAS